MISMWQNIYTTFNPVAFEIFGFKIHWYALAYITSLLLALYVARYFIRKEKKNNPKSPPFFSINEEMLMNYFIWIEVGVILGARIGYIIIYTIPYEEGSLYYYLTQPWQMFNPYYQGEFIGIRGMSYHGALIGALISTILFSLKYKKTCFWKIMDLVGLSVPLGYVFGRIGNFLNQELVGRATDVAWAINVNGVLRHPSQLYESFLEGIVVFVLIWLFYRYKRQRQRQFYGQLGSLYMLLYSLMRFIAEFFREPDYQIGYIFNIFSMGQILSLIIAFLAFLLFMAQNNYPRFFGAQTHK